MNGAGKDRKNKLNQKGDSMILLVFVIVCLVLLSLLTIDLAVLFSAKFRLQNIADAAAIGIGTDFEVHPAEYSRSPDYVTTVGHQLVAVNQMTKNLTLNSQKSKFDIVNTGEGYRFEVSLVAVLKSYILKFRKKSPGYEVQAKGIYSVPRSGNNIIYAFMVDLSDSMSRDEIDYVQDAVIQSVRKLQKGDYVTVIGYSGRMLLVVPMQKINTDDLSNPSSDLSRVISRIKSLYVPGNRTAGTYLEGAIYLGRTLFKNLKNSIGELEWNYYKKHFFIASDGFANDIGKKSLGTSEYPFVISNTVLPLNNDYASKGVAADTVRGAGRALAIQQTDYARDEGIQVDTLCTDSGCSGTTNQKVAQRVTMQRMANIFDYVPNVPTENSSMGWYWCRAAVNETPSLSSSACTKWGNYPYYVRGHTNKPKGVYYAVASYAVAKDAFTTNIALAKAAR